MTNSKCVSDRHDGVRFISENVDLISFVLFFLVSTLQSFEHTCNKYDGFTKLMKQPIAQLNLCIMLSVS